MNANELADKYENRECWTGVDTDEWCDEAATMLRQQQAEIEALKSRELTDEEIMQVADDPDLCNYDGSLRSCIDFARAILRKAQEK